MEPTRLEYWKWLHRQGYFWWQRQAPHREWATCIYEGLPGSGKTLFMVRDAIELMREGVRVYSNVAIRDPLTGLRAQPLGGWLDMLQASVQCLRDGIPTVFAFDEIHLACDARAWQSTPAWWLNLMAQRRHYGIGLMGTTQNLDTIEKRLRLLIGRVVRVRPSLLRSFVPRLPVFTMQEMDLALASAGDPEAVSRPSLQWLGAHAFHGYSTRQLMASLDFADLTDKQTAATVRKLTEEARTLADPGDIPALFDYEWEPAPSGVTFAEGVNADGDFHRDDDDDFYHPGELSEGPPPSPAESPAD